MSKSDTFSSPHGWIVLDKPICLGSTQAVGAVKRNLREAGYGKVKVGHGGTLDPMAQGVLPIALGEATKLAGRLLDATKTYEFTILFGSETDTLDAEGAIVQRTDRRPPLAAVEAVCENFTGTIDQVPPAYSAIKVDGQRAYDRARAGDTPDMEEKRRTVTIHSLELATEYENHDIPDSAFATTRGRPDPFDPQMPLQLAETVTLVAHVSKGTYIRSLARDIARALGTLGHVTYLRRIKAGPFSQSQAISLDKLNALGKGAPLKDIILPLEAGLDDIPALSLASAEAEAIRQGRKLYGQPQPDGLYCATHDTVPVALVELEAGTTRIVRGFNLPDVAE